VAPKQLFAKHDIYSIVESQKQRVKEAFDRLSDADAMNETVTQKLREDYSLKVPILRVEDQYTLPRLLMPSSLALPPVECCCGTTPSHAANSRPLPKAAPFPMAATMAIATTGPKPGIFRMRLQPASLVEIYSSLSVSSSICCSTIFHSPIAYRSGCA
jgi:hypothetical protein